VAGVRLVIVQVHAGQTTLRQIRAVDERIRHALPRIPALVVRTSVASFCILTLWSDSCWACEDTGPFVQYVFSQFWLKYASCMCCRPGYKRRRIHCALVFLSNLFRLDSSNPLSNLLADILNICHLSETCCHRLHPEHASSAEQACPELFTQAALGWPELPRAGTFASTSSSSA
jgi:hypothetical protein